MVRPHEGVFEMAGDGRDDHRGGATAKAAALHYEHRAQAALFAAHGIAQSGAVYFAAANVFHVRGHFLGLDVGAGHDSF